MNPLVGEIIDVIGRLQNMVGGSLDPRDHSTIVRSIIGEQFVDIGSWKRHTHKNEVLNTYPKLYDEIDEKSLAKRIDELKRYQSQLLI
jgi:hypothetical protein